MDLIYSILPKTWDSIEPISPTSKQQYNLMQYDKNAASFSRRFIGAFKVCTEKSLPTIAKRKDKGEQVESNRGMDEIGYLKFFKCSLLTFYHL